MASHCIVLLVSVYLFNGIIGRRGMNHAQERWIIGAGILIGIVLVLFWFPRPQDRPVPSIPEYPHRSNVVVQDEWHPYFYSNDVGLYRTTRFRTADAPALVYDFYQAQMTQAGWPLKYSQPPDELQFEFWLAAEPVRPPLLDKYVALQITITFTRTRQTEVIIYEQHKDGRRGPFVPPPGP